jgi:glutamyl-tRNA reductase
VLKELKVISISHKDVSLDLIGKLHLDDEKAPQLLTLIKEELGIKELVYLSTCNRIELILNHDVFLCEGQTKSILTRINPELDADDLKKLLSASVLREGKDAFQYLVEMTSSLHSMIIGEREIITQVRKAFEKSREWKISGDLLRLVMKKVIEGAKRVFTETHISRKPVSVVSLAWHSFKAKNFGKEEPILLLGAGQIIGNFARFLEKEGYSNITVINRSLDKAEQLAQRFSGKALTLDALNDYEKNFRVMVSCTGASKTLVSAEMFGAMCGEDESARLVIDLALPHDVDPSVCTKHNVEYIGMPQLKEMAAENLKIRSKEQESAKAIIAEICSQFEDLYHQRRVEIAMRSIPEKIREIKDTAIGVVFAEELEGLDENSKEVIEKIIQYLEKKYISVPMKMAREVMLDRQIKN